MQTENLPRSLVRLQEKIDVDDPTVRYLLYRFIRYTIASAADSENVDVEVDEDRRSIFSSQPLTEVQDKLIRDQIIANHPTTDFLIAFIKSGYLQAIQTLKNKKRGAWIEDLTYIAHYFLVTESIEEYTQRGYSIVPVHNEKTLSRQAVGQRIKSILKKMLETFPDLERKKYLVSSDKRTHKKVSSQRFSRKDNYINTVYRLFQDGLTIDEIRERLNLTGAELSKARDIIKQKYHVEIPYLYTKNDMDGYQRIAETFSSVTDFTTLQTAFSALNNLTRFHELYPDVLVSLRSIMEELGFIHYPNKKTPEVAKILLTQNIFVGIYERSVAIGARSNLEGRKKEPITKRYYLIPASIIENVKAALLSEPEIIKYSENPIIQVLGNPLDFSPRLSEYNTGKYITNLRDILTKYGFIFYSCEGQSLLDALLQSGFLSKETFPVPVFAVKVKTPKGTPGFSYFILPEHLAEFEAYFEKIKNDR